MYRCRRPWRFDENRVLRSAAAAGLDQNTKHPTSHTRAHTRTRTITRAHKIVISVSLRPRRAYTSLCVRWMYLGNFWPQRQRQSHATWQPLVWRPEWNTMFGVPPGQMIQCTLLSSPKTHLIKSAFASRTLFLTDFRTSKRNPFILVKHKMWKKIYSFFSHNI